MNVIEQYIQKWYNWAATTNLFDNVTYLGIGKRVLDIKAVNSAEKIKQETIIADKLILDTLVEWFDVQDRSIARCILKNQLTHIQLSNAAGCVAYNGLNTLSLVMGVAANVTKQLLKGIVGIQPMQGPVGWCVIIRTASIQLSVI